MSAVRLAGPRTNPPKSRDHFEDSPAVVNLKGELKGRNLKKY